MNQATVDTLISVLRAKGSLRSLELMGLSVGELGMEFVASCSSLTRIILGGVKELTDDVLEMVSVCLCVCLCVYMCMWMCENVFTNLPYRMTSLKISLETFDDEAIVSLAFSLRSTPILESHCSETLESNLK